MLWEEIGERIRKLRRNKNLTQAKFGELIGTSRQYVGQMERGKPLSLEKIAVICEKTGATMDHIVFGTVDPLGNGDFLNDISIDQIDISFDILKRVAELIKTKNGNELLIKELMRDQTMST